MRVGERAADDGELIWRRTPLDSLEYGWLELLRETRVQCPSLLTFTLDGLEIVKATLASDLALELFETVEGHARGICPKYTTVSV